MFTDLKTSAVIFKCKTWIYSSLASGCGVLLILLIITILYCNRKSHSHFKLWKVHLILIIDYVSEHVSNCTQLLLVDFSGLSTDSPICDFIVSQES